MKSLEIAFVEISRLKLELNEAETDNSILKSELQTATNKLTLIENLIEVTNLINSCQCSDSQRVKLLDTVLKKANMILKKDHINSMGTTLAEIEVIKSKIEAEKMSSIKVNECPPCLAPNS